MNFQLGTNRFDDSSDTEVLNQHGVDTGTGDRVDHFDQIVQFIGEDQRVERHVATDTAKMQFAHQ